MTNRSVVAVLFLTFITLGIYHLYWYVATKDEMNEQGATIPTAWLLIVPIASIYWLWKWSEGVEHVTRGKMSAGVSFLLIFLLPLIGMAILQVTFNTTPGDQDRLPRARVA